MAGGALVGSDDVVDVSVAALAGGAVGVAVAAGVAIDVVVAVVAAAVVLAAGEAAMLGELALAVVDVLPPRARWVRVLGVRAANVRCVVPADGVELPPERCDTPAKTVGGTETTDAVPLARARWTEGGAFSTTSRGGLLP